MTRPFMQYGVAQLEAHFASHRDAARELRRLDAESSHRVVPTARALREEVRKALAHLSAPPDNPGPKSLRLSSPPTQVHLQFGMDVPPCERTPEAPQVDPGDSLVAESLELDLKSPADADVPNPGAQSADIEWKESENPADADTPAGEPVASGGLTTAGELHLSVDDACRILKVGKSTAWAQVEKARLIEVNRSHPANTSIASDVERQRILAEAKRVNQAYLVLLASTIKD